MSSTQTRGLKRLVALGATTALGVGLLVPLAAGPAAAAPVYTATGPAAVRAALATSTLPVTLNSTEALRTATQDATYGLVFASSSVSGATVNGLAAGSALGVKLQPAVDAKSIDLGPALTFSAVGSYTIAICRDSIAPISAAVACDPTDPIVANVVIKAGGQIASFTATPSYAPVPAGGTPVPITLTYADNAGTPTLPDGTDTLTASWPTPVPGGALTLTGFSGGLPQALTNGVTALAAGTDELVATLTETVPGTPANVEITLTPSNNLVAVKKVVLNTVPSVTSLAAALTNTSNVLNDVATCATPNVATCHYFAAPSVSTFSVKATGGPAGGASFVDYPHDAGLTVTGPSFITLNADGEATFNVTVAGAANGLGFQVRFSYDGVVGKNLFSVDYQTATPTNIVFQNPLENAVVFAATGASVSVTVEVTDQYGNPTTSGAIANLYRTTTVPVIPVGAGSVNGSGLVTLSTSPSGETTDTFRVDAIAAGTGTVVDFGVFTVRYGVTPTLTITSGVTTSVNTVTTVVPGNGTVSNPTTVNGAYSNAWTPVAVQVTVGGVAVPNAQVAFSGSTGVGFASANGMLVSSGKATGAILANGAGVATIATYSTKTGTATVNAAAGTATTSGTWTVVTDTRFSRNVAVTPESLSAASGSYQRLQLSVTDGFGNLVTGTPVSATVAGPGRFAFAANALSTVIPTIAGGPTPVEVTTGPSEQGQSTFTFSLPPVSTVYPQVDNAASVPTGTGFAAAVPSAKSVVTWTGAGAVTIVSPTPGSPISSGGYFGVTATVAPNNSDPSLATGQTVALTLDGRAKATTTVGANGVIRFEKIPAQPGNYQVRFGAAGSYQYSNAVSLNIKLFSITRYTPTSGKDTFQIATGNWSRGTTIYLTRNGVSTATVKVSKMGQPVAITLNPAPGTYQVRVNSNQGPVYGDANGQVVVS